MRQLDSRTTGTGLLSLTSKQTRGLSLSVYLLFYISVTLIYSSENYPFELPNEDIKV